MSQIGTLYLLHFDRPLKQASHYIGFTSRTVEERLDDHVRGDGAKLTSAASRLGIPMAVVWTGSGTRDDERRLKNRKNARQICPKCLAEFRLKRSADRRRQRAAYKRASQ